MEKKMLLPGRSEKGERVGNESAICRKSTVVTGNPLPAKQRNESTTGVRKSSCPREDIFQKIWVHCDESRT